MATTTESLTLPSLPAEWSGQDNFKLLGKLSPATQRNIEPVGAHFLAEARRKRHKRTFSEEERIQAQESAKKTEDSDDDDISDTENPIDLQRDAKDWKQQDHYAVLGLGRYRWRATNDQIKRAHRKKVLKHHPDKRAASGSTEDDSFFKCIQKATEILSDPVKRRQFDSVDEGADVEPPTKKETKNGDFFALWRPVFQSEGRFAKVTPVPELGDDTSTKEEVEHFYNYWYTFDSWRTFEYLDEDVPDDNEHRDQKRQVEKKNANARRKKKTEDTARLRKLVDDALSMDHRIAKFKREEKESKNRRKNEREAEAKRAAEEAARQKEVDDKARKQREELDKAEKENAKKTKEAAKNAVKKNKRVVRNAAKDANYFAAAGSQPDAARIDSVLNDVDALLAKVDPDELAELTSKLTLEKDASKVHGVFSDEAARLTSAGKAKDTELASLRA